MRGLKITRVEPILCDAFRTNWVFVRVHTDGGLHGVGEATLEVKEQAVAAALRDLERAVVGEDPFEIERIWHDAYRDAYWRGGPVLMSALSGLEMALWDLKGKALGVPVYELLGGRVREDVPCYANAWFAGAREPEQFAAAAGVAADAGYGALKWDPFGAASRRLERGQLDAAVACVAAVHAAVGDRVELMIEGHGRFDVPTAIRVAHALEPFDPYFFEEPVPPDDVGALKAVADAVRVPLAAGERLYSRWDARRFLDAGGAAFVQADVTHVGGIAELRRVAAMADTHHLPLCPHNPSGPVANAATLHVAASTANFQWHETMYSDVPWRREVTTDTNRVVNGRMAVPAPDAPGLGIDLVDEAIAEHPYRPHDLRHYRGDLTDIRPADAARL